MKKVLETLRRFWRDECGAWFIGLLIAILLNVVVYLLTPKPKKSKPPPVQDLEGPVAEAGKPVPVIFGTIWVKGLNVLFFTDKNSYTYEVDA